jgi:hypothetical protein
MKHYCTLFDRNYLAKGLALHESLVRHHAEPFSLSILAMDMETFWLLSEMRLPHVEVIPLQSFERALRLQAVRESRTWAEFCWTLASSLVDYLLPWTPGGMTYLDSDLYFYSDPQAIFDELGEKSIAIIPHRFPRAKEAKAKEVGIYNVSWVTFRDTPAGMHCAQQWAAQCREWCFNKNEAIRFGDQKYLDTWEADYPGEVCAVENIGAGLAAWNIAQYRITDGPKANDAPVVFYHFHEYKDERHLTNYPLRPQDRRLIYQPYIESIRDVESRIASIQGMLNQRRETFASEPGRA